MHDFFFPFPHSVPCFAVSMSPDATSVNSIIRSSVLSVLSIICPSVPCLSWCTNCSFICPVVPSFLPIICSGVLPVLSVISPGVLNALLSVLESCLFYHLSWRPLVSPVLVTSLFSLTSFLSFPLFYLLSWHPFPFFFPFAQTFTCSLYSLPYVPTIFSLICPYVSSVFNTISVLVSSVLSSFNWSLQHLSGKLQQNKTNIQTKEQNQNQMKMKENRWTKTLEVHAVTGDGYCLYRSVSFKMCGTLFCQSKFVANKSLTVNFKRQIYRTLCAICTLKSWIVCLT